MDKARRCAKCRHNTCLYGEFKGVIEVMKGWHCLVCDFSLITERPQNNFALTGMDTHPIYGALRADV